MDESTPTHFDAILCGTGLVESILAACASPFHSKACQHAR